MSEENKTVRISVRNLVEFILREGNIDNRVSGSVERDAMQMGGRLHRKIQRRMGPEYHAEVPLKIDVPCDGFVLRLEGRADGVIIHEKDKNSVVIIDEIKGVMRDLNLVEQPVNVHLAQAKCYAYIYSVQHELKEIGVQMTYCNLETEEIRQFHFIYPADELEKWFGDLVASYEKWARFQINWKEKRNASIRPLQFPFAYREGQRDLVASVYRTILRKKKIFIQAPTGVGKTIAAVFPAVKAVGEGLGEKIFYLTAKTITRTVAEQAFRIMKEQGLEFKVITLTAKEKICFCEETECNPDACPYARGHFDRVNDAVYDMLISGKEMSRNTIEDQAEKYRVCPFEMSLDLSVWTDAVICDYNYVFDPNAHLKRFFSEGGKGEYLFLIDEAHNLVERGREMYSAQLYKEDFLEVRRLVKGRDIKLTRRLEETNKLFLALKRECPNYVILESVSHIALKLMSLYSELERFLEETGESQSNERNERLLDLYFQVRSFLNIHDRLDENYVIYSELENDGRFKIRLFCVNPAVNLQEYLEQGNSTVFFSATLLPVHYYKKLLSVETDDYAVYAQSYFPAENRLILIGSDVSSRYTQRGPALYERTARYIREAASGRIGNYMAFFPSYRFMEEVYNCFLALGGDIESIIQSQNMNEAQREEFLAAFDVNRERSMVGFCVMGGIFSEGIDLAEERLIGAVIVGTGLPQVCNEREIVKSYFDSRMQKGFDYSYLYPGMNKVLQSAGRVIRTEKDKGIIVLLDDRFLQEQYRAVFPREWKEIKVCNIGNMGACIRGFWENAGCSTGEDEKK